MSSHVQSSGAIPVTAATVVANRPSFICAVLLTPAAAASTVTLYDNASAASGTVLAVLTAPANSATVSLSVERTIECLNGITAVVTGTAAQAIVYFGKQ